ncbi:hypothetical protein ABIE65_004891 [Constrictibacter sp. MBR-5]|jgi:hypothetical protein|uniref:hypothetical protein n=1 Tax=Constrictibacter sp. MBR-5 TaxID=3156467 RepID=UPI0033988D35
MSILNVVADEREILIQHDSASVMIGTPGIGPHMGKSAMLPHLGAAMAGVGAYGPFLALLHRYLGSEGGVADVDDLIADAPRFLRKHCRPKGDPTTLGSVVLAGWSPSLRRMRAALVDHERDHEAVEIEGAYLHPWLPAWGEADVLGGRDAAMIDIAATQHARGAEAFGSAFTSGGRLVHLRLRRGGLAMTTYDEPFWTEREQAA